MTGISFIISTRYASEILEIQLKSLEYSKNLDNEFKIICDNPSWQTLKLLYDRNLMHHKDYYIVSHGHLDQNLDWGVSKATKDYICLAPDDIVFCKDFDLLISETMEDSKNRIVLPYYFVGNTSGVMFRDYGFPKLSYVAYGRQGNGFDLDKFFNEEIPSINYMFNYCGSSPVQIMHKSVYEKIHGLTFCSPHAQGHEIEMITRAREKYDTEIIISEKAYFFHFGTIGNTDQQNSAMELSKGKFKCTKCGKLDLSDGNKEHFGTKRGIMALTTGMYLCERCENDGWQINEKELKIERRE